jgi:hypothetical protein
MSTPKCSSRGHSFLLLKNPRNLGLILDPQGCYNANSKLILSKIPSRAKVIKAVTGPAFGLPLDDALLTFRATIEPVIGFSGPIWMPIVSQTWLDKFQRAQNSVLQLHLKTTSTMSVRSCLSSPI